MAGVAGYEGRVLAVYAAIGGALDSRTLMGSGGVKRCDEEEEEGGADETLGGSRDARLTSRRKSMTS